MKTKLMFDTSLFNSAYLRTLNENELIAVYEAMKHTDLVKSEPYVPSEEATKGWSSFVVDMPEDTSNDSHAHYERNGYAFRDYFDTDANESGVVVYVKDCDREAYHFVKELPIYSRQDVEDMTDEEFDEFLKENYIL